MKQIKIIKIILMIFLYFISYSLEGKDVIIIKDLKEKNIGKEVYILEDKENNKDLSTILKSFHQFERSKQEIPNFGYTNSSFWIYFKILNEEKDTQKLLLELYYPLLDEVDYYLIDNGKIIKEIKTGDRRLFKYREIYHKNFLFLLELEKNKEYEILFRVKSEGSIQIPLRLVSYKVFLEKEHIEQFIQGIYYGVMIVMILYNLFLFISIRDKSYLYYILYIFGIMMFSLIFTGYAYELLWPEAPIFGNMILSFMVNFLILFAGLFSLNFLRMKELTPILYKILFGLNIVIFINMILSLILAYKIIIKITTYSVLPFVVIVMMAGIITFRKGWKPARFYILAWTLLLISMVILALKQLGILPSNFFTNYSLQIGSALEVVLLSLGLADRINVLKEERERAQQELLNTKILMLDSFSRFVPKHFTTILHKETILDIKPGDAIEKEITVLFNDIKKFSTLSEMMSVRETFEFLNTYFEIMNPIILNHRGFIDKFIGDEIMAIFDCEVDYALDCAIAMRMRLVEFNKRIEKMNLPQVDMGIGINHGKLMLGTVGSKERLDTTVVGDTVNTAARIQQLTRIYKAPILLTQNAVNKIQKKEKYYLRKLKKVRVKGKLELIDMYECFNADEERQIEKKLETLKKYEEGLYLLEHKDVKNAYSIFKELQTMNPEDTVIKVYIELIERVNDKVLDISNPSI